MVIKHSGKYFTITINNQENIFIDLEKPAHIEIVNEDSLDAK